MQKDILRELAVVLTEQIRKNVTLDWTIKEQARAKLRVLVKRILKKYGYPPSVYELYTHYTSGFLPLTDKQEYELLQYFEQNNLN